MKALCSTPFQFSNAGRFMSMNRKLVISVFILSIFCFAALAIGFFYTYSTSLNQRIAELKQQNHQQIESKVYDSAEQIIRTTKNLSHENIIDALSLWTTEWDIESISVLKQFSDIYESSITSSESASTRSSMTSSSTPSNSATSEKLEITLANLLSANELQNIKTSINKKSDSVFISCQATCRQVISIHNNQQQIVFTRPLDKFNAELNQTPIGYTGVLQPTLISTRDVYSDNANNQNAGGEASKTTIHQQIAYKPFWSNNLPESLHSIISSKNISEWISESSSQSIDSENHILISDSNYSMISDFSKAISFSDKKELSPSHVLLHFFPIDQQALNSQYFIIATDISAIRITLLQNQLANFGICLLLIALVIVFFSRKSFNANLAIKEHANILPLITNKDFLDAKSKVNQLRTRKHYHDETDQVLDHLSSLTYQIESVQNAVNIRNREMERLSLFDSLTGLANRNLFFYELQSTIDRLSTEENLVAVITIDLDNFKRLNDSLGHQHGDMLLKKVGLRLKNITRNMGMIARLGGDEFGIILKDTQNFSNIEKLCKKIIALTSRTIDINHHAIVIHCSLGIALANPKQSANDVMKNSEIAMYDAKKRGKNTFSVFNSSMAKEAHDTLTLESDIRRAFEQNEFTLYLQPKVTMDNIIQGFEALVRWDHPERGILLPMEFIPAMETMGIINQLDDFVLDASCRQLKALQVHYPDISIAVNISSMHFTNTQFLSYLQECLHKYPIDPSKLELEITETLLMENMTKGMEIIRQIKAMGVSIAIDDFGTGYSSLSYLKKLPVDILKIDREFIKDIPDSERDMQISSVIIYLAKQLHFKVVAEGVETREQSVFLKANQCDLAQGFLFSPPLPAHKVMLLLESQGGSIHMPNTSDSAARTRQTEQELRIRHAQDSNKHLINTPFNEFYSDVELENMNGSFIDLATNSVIKHRSDDTKNHQHQKPSRHSRTPLHNQTPPVHTQH